MGAEFHPENINYINAIKVIDDGFQLIGQLEAFVFFGGDRLRFTDLQFPPID